MKTIKVMTLATIVALSLGAGTVTAQESASGYIASPQEIREMIAARAATVASASAPTRRVGQVHYYGEGAGDGEDYDAVLWQPLGLMGGGG